MTIRAKKPKKPQKPDALYTQELIVKSELLRIRFSEGSVNQKKLADFNLDTRLAAQFGTEIYNIYSSYGARVKPMPTRNDKRWKHLEECLAAEGKTMEMVRIEDFAGPLNIRKGMISDAKLLNDERRASLDGVCHVLIGLGCFAADGDNAGEDAAREEKASLRKAAVREPIRRFSGYEPKEGETKEQKEKIRRIAKPFGYWLPGAEDDEARAQIFSRIRRVVDGFAGTKRDGEEKKANESMRSAYVWLSPYRMDTLEDPKGRKSENANKLHMIIAACRRGDGAQAIENAYHAFGLHPVGLDKPKNGVQLHRWPDFPVDQVVCTSIGYFEPMIHCVNTNDFRGRMTVFWGLLYAQLDYYDRGIFCSTKLELRDQLFYKEKANADELDFDELSFYEEYYEDAADGSLFMPDEALLRRKTGGKP